MSNTQESKYTPGPWKCELAYLTNEKLDVDNNYFRIVGGEGVYLKDNGGFEFCAFLKTPDANLIAAAPDMLEALKRCKDYLHTKYPKEADIFNEIDGVIAKATNTTS